MSKYSKLTNKIDKFYKLATNQNIINIIKSNKSAIQYEINATINMINKLLSSDKKATKSSAIQDLDNILSKLSENNFSLDENNYQNIIPKMIENLNSAKFFTTKSNIGYEPLTYYGNNNSIAFHLSKIDTYLKKLNSLIKPPVKTHISS